MAKSKKDNRGIIDKVILETFDAALSEKRSSDEIKFIDGLRLEFQIILSDMDGIYDHIADPVERLMLSAVAWRLLAGGMHLGRFVEPRIIAKIQDDFEKMALARKAKAEVDKKRQEVIDHFVRKAVDERGKLRKSYEFAGTILEFVRKAVSADQKAREIIEPEDIKQGTVRDSLRRISDK